MKNSIAYCVTQLRFGGNWKRIGSYIKNLQSALTKGKALSKQEDAFLTEVDEYTFHPLRKRWEWVKTVKKFHKIPASML